MRLGDETRLADGTTPHPAVAGPPPDVELLAALRADQLALLDRLAAGATIAAAAAAEFMSLRTANRRIAAVRELFGAASTRDAVCTYCRLRRLP